MWSHPFFFMIIHTHREYLTFSFLSPLAKNVPPFFIFDFFQVFQQHGTPHSNIHKRKKRKKNSYFLVFAGRGADGWSGGIVICHCRMCAVLSACRAQFPNTLPFFVRCFVLFQTRTWRILLFLMSGEGGGIFVFSGHLANSYSL